MKAIFKSHQLQVKRICKIFTWPISQFLCAIFLLKCTFQVYMGAASSMLEVDGAFKHLKCSIVADGPGISRCLDRNFSMDNRPDTWWKTEQTMMSHPPYQRSGSHLPCCLFKPHLGHFACSCVINSVCGMQILLVNLK